MNILEKLLIKNTILSINQVEDYLHLETDNCYISILNPIIISNKTGKIIYESSSNRELLKDISSIAKEIEKKRVIRIRYRDNDSIYIKLNNKLNINIFLKEEFYSGPEALVINSKKTGAILVV